MLWLLPTSVFSAFIGNGLFVYPNQLNIPTVASDISTYNMMASNNTQISTLYVYSGSIEYDAPIWNVYFNYSSIALLSKAAKVQNIFYMFDNSQVYPSNLNFADLGNQLASYVCGSNATGIALDFEPLSAMVPFTASLVSYLGTVFNSTKFNCINARYPNGRLIAFYGVASVSSPVLDALGPNNFYILNGYDLYGNLATCESPTAYGKLLNTLLTAFQGIAKQKKYPVNFSVIAPASASTNEFTFYLKNGKSYSSGYQNFANGSGYLETALQTIHNQKYGSNYVGTTLWCYTSAYFLLNVAVGLATGNGIFVYPKGLNTDVIVSDLTRYNSVATPKSAITTVHLYTGSIDFQGKWIIPFNNASVSQILKAEKVNRVHYLFDNAILFNQLPYQELSYNLALLVCQSNHVAGLTVDFEPMSEMIEFVANLVKYMNPLLASTKYNCRNSYFPKGRMLSIYGGVKQIKPILSAFNQNNFYIVNGYDLFGDLAYSESPVMYGQLLKSVINQFLSQSSQSILFSVIIPAAASTNEFSYYIRNGKKLSNGFHTFDNGKGYVETAIRTIAQLRLGSNYVGTTLWAYTSSITVSQYSFFPITPFQLTGEMQYLGLNL
ncbi:hypothetical protein HDV06_006742 [Boothiomyces sp. JEL0866]|nr:hypothetical protein HDV06_006742 [Boothiomyces sp. JEL0866]